MGFVEREIDRIRHAIVVELEKYQAGKPLSNRYYDLYAANQALSWAVEPDGVQSPYDYIINNGRDELIEE